MKVRLLYSLKMDDNYVMVPGEYDDSKSKFPTKLYNEIERHRKGTRRKTLEILEEDKPKKTTKQSKQEEFNTLDQGEDTLETANTTSTTTSSSAKKKRAPRTKSKKKTTTSEES